MERKKSFRQRIKDDKIIVIDGAMGTYLFSKGISQETSFDYLNVTYPEMVEEVHLEYIKAGAEIIETNTFSANSVKLENYGLEDKVKEINSRGVEIARSAVADSNIYIAGSIGPLGKPFKSCSISYIDKMIDVYIEQAEVLINNGVDLLIIETLSELQEMEACVKAVRDLDKNIPVILSRTFFEDGRTLMSEMPREIAKTMSDLDVDIIGANCTVGPQRMAEIIKRMASGTSKKILSMPNAGLPQLERGKLIYQSSPEYMASYAEVLLESGAYIIGGCCGTTPAHIEAISEKIKDRKYVKPKDITFIEEEVSIPEMAEEEDEISDFGKKLGKKFIYTVELDIPRGINIEKVIKGAKYLKQHNIDAVNISDGARARLRMCPTVVAYKVLQETGMEPILHFTCRDRNLLGLQSEILGAYSLGIKNILAITGDPANIGDYPTATSVFDVDSIGLVKIISRLNGGFDLGNNPIGKPTRFTICVAANPMAKDYYQEFDKLHRKIEEGAQVIFTQPIFDIEKFEVFLDRFKKFRIPIIVGILPLRTARHAEFLHNEVPGIDIPEHFRKKMNESIKEPWRTGVDIAIEFIKVIKEKVAGVYLMPPFEKYEMATEIIENIEG